MFWLFLFFDCLYKFNLYVFISCLWSFKEQPMCWCIVACFDISSLKILDELIDEVFPATIKFLTKECCTAMFTDTGLHAKNLNSVTPGIREMDAFLKIFSALLDKVILREELEKKARYDDSNIEGISQMITIFFFFCYSIFSLIFRVFFNVFGRFSNTSLS